MIFGCGYVGTALAKALLAAGVQVGAFTRTVETAAHLQALGLGEVIIADLHGSVWHDRLQGSYYAVVNCVSSAGGGPEGYRKSYVEGQRSILQWLEGQSTVHTYLYTGSTSVYPQDGGVEVDETVDTSAALPTVQALLEAEQILAAAADRLGAWYVLRLAGIYGPGRHYLLNMLRSGERVIPGVGDYFLNLIHREDIVSAICRALAYIGPPASGIYNLADNAPARKAEIVEWLAEQLGVPMPRFDPDQVSPRLKRRSGHMPSRRVLSGKFRRTFGWTPRYADFRAGYGALLER